MWAGYWGSHYRDRYDAGGPSASALLVLGLTTMLGGVGFLDDFIKIRKQRNLGLNKTAKLVGQLSRRSLSESWRCSSPARRA